MKFPKLYKLGSTSKVQTWEISTEDNVIKVVHGQQDGKMQESLETISKGKNVGRSNETSPAEQADAEAQAKWDKKHNKDYHLKVEDCNRETANTGGYLPMLAQSYTKHGEKYLQWPCYVQPKLDGIRCISTRTDEGVKLWFRGGKEITSMPHIVRELEMIMHSGDIFDGELYAHGEDFNSSTGSIRGNKNLKLDILEKIKYHIYDVPRIDDLNESSPYIDRLDKIEEIFENHINPIYNLNLVKTFKVDNFKQAMAYYKLFIDEGYEGIMLRNIDMPYQQKRSYNLLKYKEFVDHEVEIIGVKEGKGKLAGHVGSFICKLVDGSILPDIGGIEKTYLLETDKRTEKEGKGTVCAKMKGKDITSYLKHLFEHPEEYMGKSLTIVYQNLSEDIVPRFPVAKAERFDL